MKINITRATRFVLLMGLISLFADMTYEAARSINGPFLELLHAKGATVGFVAGLGELLGYGLRFLTGYITDKTKKYWLISIIGYSLNLLSVPLLALAGFWQVAIVLMIAERVGKAIRTPARDALLSFGVQEMGIGWGFGLHEAMDQIGATIGPLLVSAVLFYQHQNYQLAYAFLLIPALLALVTLLAGRYLYPNPENLVVKKPTAATTGYSSVFWLYLLAVIMIAAGYADFPLIAFHFKTKGILQDAWIPIFYSVAMATDAIASLILGKLFDRIGVKTMLAAVFISLFFAPLVFFGNSTLALTGMILWGIGMGAQESIMKAVVADMVPSEKRATAFGTLNAVYGIAWFAGSALIGILYDHAILGVVIFSVSTQLIAAGALIVFLTRRK